MTQLSEAETLRRKAADRLAEAENRQKQTDKAATDALQALSQSREARVRAEERVMAADERRKEIEARIREVLNVPPHLVVQHAGLDPDEPLPDMGEMERKLERLKIERERLGAVNLRAEEEQRELSERLEAIISEREDNHRGDPQAAWRDPEPEPGRPRAPCWRRSRSSTATSSDCSRISSAAARRSCS